MAIRKDRIQFFEQHLTDFFRKTGRSELPWRKKNITAYEVWVSEIMLQQTQVNRVVLYYQNFLRRFPTVESLAQANWEDFLPYYEGLGYYARGRNMLRTAQMVVQEHQGLFPRDKTQLQTLPGVGPYTAAAIMSFAYGKNHLAWDTNLKRVIGRFFFGGKQLVADEEFWEDAFTVPKKKLNAALMDFGSALCTARPKCAACALRVRCLYAKEGGQRELGKKKSRKNESEGHDWAEARAIVFLHESHKKYYSSDTKKFQPFLLPAGYQSRSDIKQYFQKTYGLTVAVRPAHAKRLIRKQPVILVNAQILLGQQDFVVFSKKAVAEYNKSIV
jgi:A/G-specific adenine glycosylase